MLGSRPIPGRVVAPFFRRFPCVPRFTVLPEANKLCIGVGGGAGEGGASAGEGGAGGRGMSPAPAGVDDENVAPLDTQPAAAVEAARQTSGHGSSTDTT